MRWICFVLVVTMTTTASAAMRYMDGQGFPTTETSGGDPFMGTLDWGSPSDISSLEYAIQWGNDSWAGEFDLLATNIAGSSAQLIYSDVDNQLTLTAISADGPFALDADTFVDTAGYGGFEAWTLTNSNPSLNRYGTITGISAVPEPGLKMIAVCGGLCLLVFRRRFVCRASGHAVA